MSGERQIRLPLLLGLNEAGNFRHTHFPAGPAKTLLEKPYGRVHLWSTPRGTDGELTTIHVYLYIARYRGPYKDHKEVSYHVDGKKDGGRAHAWLSLRPYCCWDCCRRRGYTSVWAIRSLVLLCAGVLLSRSNGVKEPRRLLKHNLSGKVPFSSKKSIREIIHINLQA
jgi:hypothetical protein